jgi:hypothetical protein
MEDAGKKGTGEVHINHRRGRRLPHVFQWLAQEWQGACTTARDSIARGQIRRGLSVGRQAMVGGGSGHAFPLLVVWEAEALMQDSL